MMFVYGTKGTAEENAWALAKSRYDAETFAYRGNGSIDVVADTEFEPEAEPDRNVILYGNADTNAAWAALLGASPVQVRRGSIRSATARRRATTSPACSSGPGRAAIRPAWAWCPGRGRSGCGSRTACPISLRASPIPTSS